MTELKTVVEQREEILARALDKLKTDAKGVIDGVMSDLYSSYLPYVETDTESNIGYRVDGVLKNLLTGKFKKIADDHVLVGDGYNCTHAIYLASWNMTMKPLCDLMGEKISSERIKELEREVESLNESIKRAYRQF